MRRVLEPNKMLRWRFDLLKPLGGNLRVDVEVVAAGEDDQRAFQFFNVREIEAENLREQIRLGKIVALPDMTYLIVRVVGRQ
jgi:hypothetical protein